MGSRKLTAVACVLILLGTACTSGSTTESQAASPSVPDTSASAAEPGNGDPDEAESIEGSTDTDRSEEDRSETDRSEEDKAIEEAAEAAAEATEPDPAFGDLDATTAAVVTLLPAEPGDNGDEVLALQERLADLGFSPGTPDSDYGRGTTAAVEAFQMVVGRERTGVADAATVNALMDYSYDGLVLAPGDEGPQVKALQERLRTGPFDPGEPDSEYGTRTTQAVWALEKLAGVPVDGAWGPLDEWAWESLQDGEIGTTERSHDIRWVEVDLSEQLFKVYDPGSTTPVLISHVSSGSRVPWENEEHSGSSITPLGEFHIYRRISGWRESSLNIGRLYNPLYFTGGIAFHGAQSVPLYPASHGCVRVPMHIADYLPGELPDGTPVHVDA